MRIKILANPKKPWAQETARELRDFLKPDHDVVVRKADATVCIGGDGTILYNSHKGRLEGPVLGIGGDSSYICQLHKDDWKGRIMHMLSSGRTVKVLTLECSLGAKLYIALNDVVVHATHYRVAELTVSYETGNRKQETRFEGDGMIISTALGSAAYAFSAGGEKLPPTERKLSLVPICPYKRAFSPIMLSEEASISLEAGSDCAFISDGIFVRHLRKGERITAKKGPDLEFFEGIGRSF
ncbi:MAG: hypothetical protein AB1295_05595 [Candidatus Micrarchaeota archaeon]